MGLKKLVSDKAPPPPLSPPSLEATVQNTAHENSSRRCGLRFSTSHGQDFGNISFAFVERVTELEGYV